MRPADKNPVGRDEFDGDDAEVIDGDLPIADAEAVDPVDSLDEDLLEADLGERDEFIALDEDEDLDDDAIDPDDFEDDDEYEVLMLQELGIDLDAADASEPNLDLEVALVDDETDDGVAA